MTTTLENSDTQLQYNYAENIGDNRGITLGCIGFCTGTYDANAMIKYYITLNPDNNLAKYIPALNKIDTGSHRYNGGDSNPSVVGLNGFIKDVQNNKDPLFKQAQLYELDQMYYNPAVKLWNDAGCKNYLTLAFIYDTCINHGSEDAATIIKKAGKTPKQGTDENTFLQKLITARKTVLGSESSRVNGYSSLLKSGNVNLKTPFAFTAWGDKFTIDGNLNEVSETTEPTEEPEENNTETPSGNIKHVGKGYSYSTDGKDDQKEINKAISDSTSGDTVYLHGNLVISSPVNIKKSGIVFKGDGIGKTVIKASSYKAFLGGRSDETKSMIQLYDLNSGTFTGFTLSGVAPQKEPSIRSENGFLINHCQGLKFANITFTLVSDDGMRVYCDPSKTKDCYVTGCTFDTTDHDCIDLWDARNWHISDCKFNVKSNCGIGLADCQNIYIKNNEFYSNNENGNGGIQLQGTLKNIFIDGNNFHDMLCSGGEGVGIYEDEDPSGTVTITNNIFSNCPGGNIVTKKYKVVQSGNVFG